jgi:hypothetical protein
MRVLIFILITTIFCFSCRKEEFREDPDKNHYIDKAINANLGKYIATGIVNTISIDSIDIQINKVDASTIQIVSNRFSAFTIVVNNLTQYDGYATPGGAGLNLVSASREVQFSILNSSMILKFQNAYANIDLAGKKVD